MPATDNLEHIARLRHPCCAGPDDSNPVADVTHASPLHRTSLAPKAITGRVGSMTEKGEDQ